MIERDLKSRRKMTVTLNLSPETERSLRERAAQNGLALETYLRQLLERDTQAANAGPEIGSAVQVSPAEFDRRLDELSEGLPPLVTLPTDWSRADLYANHD
jgi:hypothetical protein